MSNENVSNDKWGQLTNDSQLPINKPSIDEVDQLADELVAEYNNPGWRSWYCGYINRYGIAQIAEWREKARKAREPARLFSTYLKQARDRGVAETNEIAPRKSQSQEIDQLPAKADTVYIPMGKDIPTQAQVDAFVGGEIDKFIEQNPPAVPSLHDDE